MSTRAHQHGCRAESLLFPRGVTQGWRKKAEYHSDVGPSEESIYVRREGGGCCCCCRVVCASGSVQYSTGRRGYEEDRWKGRGVYWKGRGLEGTCV